MPKEIPNIEQDKWYTREEIKAERFLGDYTCRLDSGFARKKNRMLEFDASGRISGRSLIALNERLTRVVRLAELEVIIGVKQGVITSRCNRILDEYIENIFPQKRKGYSPLYVMQEGKNYEEFVEKLKEAEIRRTGFPIPDTTDKAEKIKFLEGLVEELAGKIPYDEAVAAEELVARQTNYKGEKYISCVRFRFKKHNILANDTGHETEMKGEIQHGASLEQINIALDAPKKEEEVGARLVKKRKVSGKELQLDLGDKGLVKYCIDEDALKRYLRNEDITEKDFEKIDAPILRSQLEMELKSLGLKENMRIKTKGYIVEIESGVIVSLM